MAAAQREAEQGSAAAELLVVGILLVIAEGLVAELGLVQRDGGQYKTEQPQHEIREAGRREEMRTVIGAARVAAARRCLNIELAMLIQQFVLELDIGQVLERLAEQRFNLIFRQD